MVGGGGGGKVIGGGVVCGTVAVVGSTTGAGVGHAQLTVYMIAQKNTKTLLS